MEKEPGRAGKWQGESLKFQVGSLKAEARPGAGGEEVLAQSHEATKVRSALLGELCGFV
jgi:hypothetical protein